MLKKFIYCTGITTVLFTIIYLLMNVAPVASDKYFLAIVLKRLLARKKRFGDSRSVGKLIRKMIE